MFFTTGEWERVVLEESEHSVLGHWIHLRLNARGGREEVPGDGDQGETTDSDQFCPSITFSFSGLTRPL